MSTDIRPELSKKHPYHISRHRYYELKHFVMQYPEWRASINSIDSVVRATNEGGVQVSSIPNPVCRAVELREKLNKNIDLCNRVASETSSSFGGYILHAIINNLSYDKLRARDPMFVVPKDTWYILYRKFFWLLDLAKSANTYMKNS